METGSRPRDAPTQLNDVTGQNGGQRSEVGSPWNSTTLERGLSDEYDKHGGRGKPKKK